MSNIDKLIGLDLNFVVKELENEGFNLKLIDNSNGEFGDSKLVTNIKINGKNALIVYSSFILIKK